MVVLDQPLGFRVLYGNYEAPPAPFLPLVFCLISPLLFGAKPTSHPGDSDRVTGTAIIHEINAARQNPTLYATFLEQSRQNYAGRARLIPASVRLSAAVTSTVAPERADTNTLLA